MYCIQQPPSTVTKKLLCSSHCYHLSPSSSSSISLSTKCSYLFLLSLFSSHFLMNFSLLLPPIVLSVSFAPSLNHSFMYCLDFFSSGLCCLCMMQILGSIRFEGDDYYFAFMFFRIIILKFKDVSTGLHNFQGS